MTSAVVKRLAHELDVIERAGLAEFFLICWDLMRFAKEQGIPAQGRGSATSSIVSYTLGISRVEPIAHNLLFERFINPGRTTYPDVDIDFSSERREEVIQYVYEPLRPRAHGDGLQPRHVPGALGGARGGLRARVPAAARGSRREGARDVRLGHGPARPRGGRRVRRVLPTAGRGAAGRGGCGRGRRGARLRRRDGPAEHAGAARREGAALAPATEAGGPERAATVRLAPGGTVEPRPPDVGVPRCADLASGHAAGDPAGRRDGRRGRARATRRRASPGCGRAGGPATRRTASGSSRRRSSTAGGSIRRAASSSRRRARTDRAADKLGPPDALGSAGAAPRRPGRRGRPLLGRADRAGAAAPGPRRLDRRASRTGSAGSSSAPGSMASRAISRSIRAGCW